MYSTEIKINDYEIVIEYSLDDDHNGVLLESYTVFNGNNEVNIPCAIESKYIEDKVDEMIEYLSQDVSDLICDYNADRGDRAYDLMMDK